MRPGLDAIACEVCASTSGRVFTAREMMFGFRDEFTYRECAGCGAAQCLTRPADLQRFYPSSYYSYAPLPAPLPAPRNRLRRWLFFRRNLAQIFGTGGLFGLFARLRPRPDFAQVADIFGSVPFKGPRASILDIGCGQGQVLRTLASAGLERLVGVDPFLSEGFAHEDRLQILAADPETLRGRKFDIVLLDHSLEHVPSQRATLSLVADLLADDGTAIVRMPVVPNDLWDEYGPCWVALDPPRHLFVHSRRSFSMLCAGLGLEVARTVFDVGPFCYWGSELYRRGIPLVEGQSRLNEIFSRAELEAIPARARAANAREHGSTASFYIRRSRVQTR